MNQIEMDIPAIEMTVNAKKLVPWISYLIFFAVLNETVFNVATPKIAEQFSLGLSGVSWIMTIFMIFFGICSIIYGKLSDLYSLKRLIVIGVVIYSVGSIIGFVFQSSYLLIIVARAVQGIGASAIPALIFVVVARYFPVAERGKIFGLITATVSFGIGLGPVIGGFVAGSLHWSFLFVIPLFTLIAIPFLRKELPEEKQGEGSVDIIGATLVGLTIGALMVYLTFSDWYYLAAFVILLAGFIISIRTTTNPFIDSSLFKNRLFRNGVIIGFSLFSIVIGVLFVIPLMLHEVHGLSTSEIGLILFPGAISSVVFGPIGGSLADRKGNNFVVVIGLGLLVASLILISLLMTISPWLVSASLLLLYVGFSLFQTALVNSVSQTLPVHKMGVGMGLFNLVSIISGAMGTALFGKILDGKWLAFRVFSVSSNAKTFAYCNLLILFSIVVILGGLLYLRSYQNLPKASQLVQE
jgi:MFS transporter, DHA2 family, metal-tetracycline-proton antiporter